MLLVWEKFFDQSSEKENPLDTDERGDWATLTLKAELNTNAFLCCCFYLQIKKVLQNHHYQE